MTRMRLAFALACFFILHSMVDASDDRAWPATAAERSGFRETARHEDVLQFLDALANRAEHVRRFDFGSTVEGRPLAAVSLASPPVQSPADAAKSGKLIALIIANIHAGECDGKEAMLALARELASDPDHPLLENLVLLIVPNFNADGNERMAANNRPGQVGPDRMGRRANAQGLDLNRDFVKLETPEVQALVRLIHQWDPHVFIDCHTTNGSRHRYDLTFETSHNPAVHPSVIGFARDELLPGVMRRLDAAGLSTFFYGNFDRTHSKWTSYGHEPRYAIEYVGLRGRIAILAESYSYRGYRERIESTGAFVRACLGYISEHRERVRAVTGEAARRSPALEDGAVQKVAIRAKLQARQPAIVKGYETTPQAEHDEPPATQLVAKDYKVDHVDRAVATLEVARPLAYLIPSDQTRLVDKLLQHGIEVAAMARSAAVDVEVYRLEKVESAAAVFQGNRLRTASVAARVERREAAAGVFVVPCNQRLGNLATYLLEPASDDGLFTWNQFALDLEPGQDYPVVRLTQTTQLTVRQVQQVEPGQKLDLDQIYGPENPIPFAGTKTEPPRWIPGSSDYLEHSGGTLMRTSAETSETRPFHAVEKMERALAALQGLDDEAARSIARQTNFNFNANASAALITHQGDLFYYHFQNGVARQLTATDQQEQHATFSPNGERVAFVREHNLFTIDIETGRETALTVEGSDKLMFGELDWIYQEELYGRGNFKAYWWSPDSNYIALLRLDESEVKPFTVVDHLPYRQELEVGPYPKAGDPNPKVALGVVAAGGGPVRWIDLSDYDDVEPLIVRVGWTPDSSRVVYEVQNREQTWLDLLVAERGTGDVRELLRETSAGWVEVLDLPHWLGDGSFLWLSERTGWRHIYRVSADGSGVTAMTSGEWGVQELAGVDEQGGWVYFTGTKDSAIASGAYRVRLDGSSPERLTERPGHHSVSFDESHRYFIDTWSDVHTPPQLWLFDAAGKRLRAIDPNLADHLKHYQVNRPEFLQVPARDGFLLDAMVIKPPGFDPAKKYPVLCYVYSGPQAPVVRDRWSGPTYLWHQMLAQRGYVIWSCDNRSARASGIGTTLPIHRRLGELELRDIEDGLAWLKGQSWVAGDRIGIWGWSYGGYMTGYAMTHSRMFKIGISGAPVTDWRNYDSIYTERYMGLPGSNEVGYRQSSVVEHADRLHGRLLLLHGTIDDNVHLGNTIQLAGALQRAGKQFGMMLYPKSRHGVVDPNQLRHMRELMTRFIEEHL